MKKTTNTPDKTEELIIYIASRLQNKPNYGAVLLNKTLYLVDSVNFLKSGKPISSLSYIRQDRGATPKPVQFLPILEKMQNTGDINKISNDYFGRAQTRFVPTRTPVVDVFEKDELVLMNDVIDSISDMNATEASDYNHTFISWIFAQHKEELPFYTFLLTSKDPQDKDIAWAKQEIKSYEKSKANS